MLRRLAKETELIKGRSIKGLVKAAYFVLEDTEKTPPLVPVLTGSLRGSTFVRKHTAKSVRFGFGEGVNYAAKVHFKEGNVNWTRPGSGPFFFSASLTRNKFKILDIIRDNAKR